ncbi:MAG: glutamine--fructose-6-phosphate transaminase (isomerizing) [Clostridia bacterium]|nr:glutamine--fructose-6-phosphate transaminase (isomerizing) [Clostridia bacterium]
MCGIVGYTGNKQAAPILLDGLSKLEYRGYDSAGVAVCGVDGKHNIVKTIGKLSVLSDKLKKGKAIKGKSGIGHTRWATHGMPSEVNAHPHNNDDKSIVAVHNGIIENYVAIKEKLTNKGYEFYSETDTEIATKLVDYYYKKWKSPVEAMVSFTLRVRGSYALAVMFEDYPGEIYIARKDSPLIVGVNDDESFIASDVPAVLKYTRNIYYVDNMEIARIERGKATFYNVDHKVIKKKPVKIDWDLDAAEKGGYKHFMLKEMHEQPKVVSDTLNSFIKNGKIDLSEAGITDGELRSFNRIRIAACGSAYHVGVVAKYVIEDMARVPVDVDVASEFRYRNPVFGDNELLIIISQSGETADSLAALRGAKESGVKTLAIVNVLGSSIAREADRVLYTKAGPEISVATTKAYSAQLIVAYVLAVQLSFARGKIDADRYESLIGEMLNIPSAIQTILSDDERLKWFATKISNKKDVFFIGRGIDYAICLEGSLKLKEISYIHSEAYAAGELKHGTISLIEEGTLVIGVLTQMQLAEKSISNLVEVKSRGAYVMSLTCDGTYSLEEQSEFTVYIPKTDPYFAASLAGIPLQLLSYYVSVAKGLDVDMPRNLAKCVAVE